MADIEQAKATQLRNIEAKTGKSIAALCAEIAASGKSSHGEVRTWVIERFGLGYGDANALAHAAKAPATSENFEGDPLAALYAGKKEHLRSIHDALIAAITRWGPFEQAPKKAYVALRRKKQFAMLGPKNANAAELGINLKDAIDSSRIVAQKPGGMCQYAVLLTSAEDIDPEVLGVLRRAFDAAE
jgi:predicted transport protein